MITEGSQAYGPHLPPFSACEPDRKSQHRLKQALKETPRYIALMQKGQNTYPKIFSP